MRIVLFYIDNIRFEKNGFADKVISITQIFNGRHYLKILINDGIVEHE